MISYILDDDDSKKSLICKIAKERNYEILELNKRNPNERSISVEEWVASIANATMVVTDSFHGCVFSIIFNRPLIFIPNENRGSSRFDTLIKQFGINNNRVRNIAEYSSEYSYSLPESSQYRLTELRDKSLDYLSLCVEAQEDISV